MKRYFRYAVIVSIIATPIAFYFWYTRDTDEVQSAIVRIGFDPLNPPNKALTLGSYYYVSLDGSRPRPVCSADPDRVKDMVEMSPLPEIVASKLVNAHANVQAEMLRAVKAEAAIEDQLAIEYSFRDTKLYQMNGADLVAIEHLLFEETNCNTAISEYINNVGLICQIQSALMATVKYRIKRKDGRKITDEDAEKIKGALEVTTGMKGLTVTESNIESLGLFYGIIFKPKCVTNSEFGLIYPQTKMDRLLLHARLLWKRLFS